jgi:hypothetical protein
MPQTPQRAPRSGAGAFTLLAVLAFLALAAFILMRRETVPVAVAPTLTTPAASPSPLAPSEPPPSALAEASPEPSPIPSAEPASPAPAVPGEPRPRRRAAPAEGSGTRVADAGVATSQLPPLPPPPTSGGGRRFVLGATTVESLKPVARTMPGFDASGVGVKRAPQVNGRVVLEMDPPQVRPGVDFVVRVYLANDGDQDIPVQGLTLVTLEDGKRTSRTPAPAARTVKPKQRALVHEMSGVWREAARTWSMEATVTSSKQDVYKNRLSWE